MMKVRDLIEVLPVTRLRELCVSRGLSSAGRKADLQTRLARSCRGKPEEILSGMLRKELVEQLRNLECEGDGHHGEFTYLAQANKADLQTLLQRIVDGTWTPNVGENTPLGEACPIRIRWSGSDDESQVRLLSTHYSDDTHHGIATLSMQSLHRELAEAKSLSIASAFYDTDFFRGLLNVSTLPKLKRVAIALNGLSGERLNVQRDELQNLRKELSEKIDHVEIRLMFNKEGLFHSKLLIADTGKARLALVGSANATTAAMERNEEILVRLKSTALLDQYFTKVWTAAQPLDEQVGRARNLTNFFRLGRLYFKATGALNATINPFPELLRALVPQERAKLGAVKLPYASASGELGPFELRAALGLEDEGEDEDEESTEPKTRVSIRPYVVETCFGYWTPYRLAPAFDATCAIAAKSKLERLNQLATRLEETPHAELGAKYDQYIAAAEEALRRAGIDLSLRSELRLDPFNSQDWFEGKVKTLKKNLANPRYRNRLCRPFSSVPMPEIWDDVVASTDFRDSFFQYLSYVASLSTKPRVPRRLFDKACEGHRERRVPDPSEAEELRDGFMDYLKMTGWDDATEWGIGSSVDDGQAPTETFLDLTDLNIDAPGPQPTRPVTRADAGRELPPLSKVRRLLPFRFDLTEAETIAVTLGFVPCAGDHKFFIFLEGSQLFIHRKWSASCAFVATLRQTPQGAVLDDIWANNEPDERSGETLGQAREAFTFAIAKLLVERGAADPSWPYSRPRTISLDQDVLVLQVSDQLHEQRGRDAVEFATRVVADVLRSDSALVDEPQVVFFAADRPHVGGLSTWFGLSKSVPAKKADAIQHALEAAGADVGREYTRPTQSNLSPILCWANGVLEVLDTPSQLLGEHHIAGMGDDDPTNWDKRTTWRQAICVD